MAHVGNKTNEYARTLGPLLDQIPKAVLAAVAVSFAMRHGSSSDGEAMAILREWSTLYDNGIVPQKPPRALMPPSMTAGTTD